MTDGQSLEQKAFDGLDLIYVLADAALVAQTIGRDDDVESALERIKEIAESWEDPDSDAFENSDIQLEDN